MSAEIPEDLGRIVRFHRKRSGLTQAELARMAGVGKTVVFQIEKGKTTVRLDTASKILAVLNVRLRAESPLMDEMDEAANGDEKEKP
jgi:HTH-type transcriptional regulator/antitoxin HipB